MTLVRVLLLAATAAVAAPEPPPQGSQPAAESAVVVIRTPNGGGTGFLASLDGKTYIITNQHVLMGANGADVKITFVDGTKAQPTRAEIAGDIDLVRLEISLPRKPLELSATPPRNGDGVLAIGNSLDAGVITTGEGTIKGVGENEVETDCDFVPGNSGGPVLDETGHVVGVATYIRIGEKSSTTAGTRYEKGRRFAVRLRPGMKWFPVDNWARYAQAGAVVENARRLGDEIYAAARSLSSNQSLANFKPENQRVAAAVSDFERLQSRLSKMDGDTVTARELDRNNNILGITYRAAFLKLREASAPTLKELQARKYPPEWGWLEKERKETLEDLENLDSALEKESKNKPTFLQFQ